MYVRTDMRRYIHKRNVQALAGRQAAEKQQQQLQKDMKEPSLPQLLFGYLDSIFVCLCM